MSEHIVLSLDWESLIPFLLWVFFFVRASFVTLVTFEGILSSWGFSSSTCLDSSLALEDSGGGEVDVVKIVHFCRVIFLNFFWIFPSYSSMRSHPWRVCVFSWCLRHQGARCPSWMVVTWIVPSSLTTQIRWVENPVDLRFADVTDEVTRKTVSCFLGRRRQEHPPFGGHGHSGLHQEQITTSDHGDGLETLRHLAVECRFARRVRHVTL